MAADTKSMPIPWPEDAEIKVYTGGCHCKKIRYEFEHPDIYAMPVGNCNCSICEDRGYLSVYTTADRFRFTSGSDADITKYEFNTRHVGHRFCSTCGTSIGPTVPSRGLMVVNARSIDGIDLERLKLHNFNGRSLPRREEA
ncbi:Mss4-like protein [Mycena sanguinolenta]|nr:Mss4-like protein [Mycena sanguinolenta]